MTKNNNINSSYNMCDTSNYCNNLANQFNFLATIYTAIISQEIEDDEVLGLLGSFLIVLGEQVSFASETRIFCKSQLEEEENNLEADTNIAVEDIFDRSTSKSKPKSRYRKIRKRIKKEKQIKNKTSRSIYTRIGLIFKFTYNILLVDLIFVFLYCIL